MTTPLMPRVGALAAYLFMIVMNVLSTTLPLNGQTPEQISDRYDTLFAPIGFTFSIWGIIFTLLGVFAVYQLIRDNDLVAAIRPWFTANVVLNGVWIVTWHWEVLWASLIVMLALLVSLIVINQKTTSHPMNWASTFAVRLPFSIYFGWITVATVANVSALIVQLGYQGGGILSAEAWTITILIVAAAIGIATTLINKSMAYGLVLVWAYWGILARHLSPDEWNQEYPSVILTTQILLPILALVSLAAGALWLRQRRGVAPMSPLKEKVTT